MALDIKNKKPAYNAAKSMHRGVGIKRKFASITIVVVVVAGILVGAAAGYTWYMGRFAPPIVDDSPAPRPTAPIATPQPVNEDVRVGVSVQSFTDKVAPGKNASLIIKTNPLAACSITVEYNKQASTDSGLVPKKADEFGVASWAWTVEESRPIGKWPVKVTCANAKHSGELVLDLVVANE